MEKNIVAIDLSMRSTGITRFKKNKLVDFSIISDKKLKEEELLIWNAKQILFFCKKFKTSQILIEGLSYLAKSKSLDLIHGNFWYVRSKIKEYYGIDMDIQTIPVLKWRNKILSNEELKKARKIKNGLKNSVVDKLPKNIRKKFEKYIITNKYSINSIYDLADSYFIGKYFL